MYDADSKLRKCFQPTYAYFEQGPDYKSKPCFFNLHNSWDNVRIIIRGSYVKTFSLLIVAHYFVLDFVGLVQVIL